MLMVADGGDKGKAGALFLWTFVCLTAFCVCQAGLQAGSRSIYAFSRDHGESGRAISFSTRS